MGLLELGYTYRDCVANSEKISWTVDEVMPRDKELDFSRHFLPKQLADFEQVDFLNGERKQLNQIAGNAYLNIFAFVEEYILSTIVQLASAEMFGDHDAIRALCRFADEEVKHQQLFARYREAFERGFGHPCEVLQSAAQVAGFILEKSPIGYMLLTLHIELMTQQHFTQCVKGNQDLDPFFASLLRNHWLEESQHAKIDALELEKVLEYSTPEMVAQGVEDYLAILEAFKGVLLEQATMDVASLRTATGREFTEEQATQLCQSVHRAYLKTFVIYGMENLQFKKIVTTMSPEGASLIASSVELYK